MDLNVAAWDAEVSSIAPRRARCEVLESHAGTLAALSGGGDALGPHAPSPLQGATQLLVVFPGNPGVCHFYDQFVLAIARRAPGTLVLVVGFIGHAVAPPPTKEGCSDTFVLQDQIEHADDFLRRAVFCGGRSDDVTRTRSGLKVSVAGHSIGAYVALHMAARFRTWVDRALLLTPTIMDMAGTPNGLGNHWGLTPVVTWALSGVLVPALRCLPAGVQRAVVARAEPRMTAPHRRIVGAMNESRVVRNVLTLARSEFAQLRALDVALLRALGNRAVCYCTHADGWVPFSHVGEIQAACPEVDVVVEHDRAVKHAWCCYNAEHVGAFVAERLNRPLPDAVDT